MGIFLLFLSVCVRPAWSRTVVLPLEAAPNLPVLPVENARFIQPGRLRDYFRLNAKGDFLVVNANLSDLQDCQPCSLNLIANDSRLSNTVESVQVFVLPSQSIVKFQRPKFSASIRYQEVLDGPVLLSVVEGLEEICTQPVSLPTVHFTLPSNLDFVQLKSKTKDMGDGRWIWCAQVQLDKNALTDTDDIIRFRIRAETDSPHNYDETQVEIITLVNVAVVKMMAFVAILIFFFFFYREGRKTP